MGLKILSKLANTYYQKFLPLKLSLNLLYIKEKKNKSIKNF